jgi:hypothetical protein
MKRRSWSPRSLIAARDGLVLVLAGTAGCVDAISYLGLGHVFTANMTGNTVLLGVSLGQLQWRAARGGRAAACGHTGLRQRRDVVKYLKKGQVHPDADL